MLARLSRAFAHGLHGRCHSRLVGRHDLGVLNRLESSKASVAFDDDILAFALHDDGDLVREVADLRDRIDKVEGVLVVEQILDDVRFNLGAGCLQSDVLGVK